MHSRLTNKNYRIYLIRSWLKFIATCQSFYFGFILAYSTISLVVAANAADFIDNDKGITIAGTFVDGDYKKFENLLVTRSNEGRPTRGVTLVSHGGDIKTALAIGRLIRKNWLVTNTLGTLAMSDRVFSCSDRAPPEIIKKWNGQCTCDSACFLVWASGINRFSMDGILGIHRPYFGTLSADNLSKPETGNSYVQITDELRNYLREMNIPDPFFEIMMSKNSTEVYRLSQAELDQLELSPLYEEAIIKTCGRIADKVPELKEAEDRDIALAVYNYENNSKFVLTPEDQNLVSEWKSLLACQQKVLVDAQDHLQKQ